MQIIAFIPPLIIIVAYISLIHGREIEELLIKRQIKKIVKHLLQRHKDLPKGMVFDENGAHAKNNCTNHQILQIDEWITKNHLCLQKNVIKHVKKHSKKMPHNITIDDAIIVHDQKGNKILHIDITE